MLYIKVVIRELNIESRVCLFVYKSVLRTANSISLEEALKLDKMTKNASMLQFLGPFPCHTDLNSTLRGK